MYHCFFDKKVTYWPNDCQNLIWSVNVCTFNKKNRHLYDAHNKPIILLDLKHGSVLVKGTQIKHDRENCKIKNKFITRNKVSLFEVRLA